MLARVFIPPNAFLFIAVTVEGIISSLMLTQFSKAFSPIVESVLFSVNVACERAEQPLNAFAEINVTLSGIVMPERSIQFSNALCPIVVAVPLPVQSVTVVRAGQSLNAFAPIEASLPLPLNVTLSSN